MICIDLSKDWSMKDAKLSYGREKAHDISNSKDGWKNGIDLPCDIHQPLILDGIIKDPVLSDYHTLSAEQEKHSWWFKKVFTTTRDEIEKISKYTIAELILDGLDCHADVLMNGIYVGHQESAFYPFAYDVKSYVREGDNELLIRLTTGTEHVSDADVAELDWAAYQDIDCRNRGDLRRMFLRKPQYVFGWDWCPRIATCAINGKAKLNLYKDIAIRGVAVDCLQATEGGDSLLRAEVEIEGLDISATLDIDLEIVITSPMGDKTSVKRDRILVKSGLNYFAFEITIANSMLWWPNGMGTQNLYTIEIKATCNEAETVYPLFNYGIRRLELDTSYSTDDPERRNFTIMVNGISVFCKGGNWIPADSLYARVSGDKYDELVCEAKEANFNMLRVWGGGLYERDEFYDACDMYGIMVWQDMMFACSVYPDHREDYYNSVRNEMDYQTKRLRNRACLALFCGNNENHWTFYKKYWIDIFDYSYHKQYGFKVCNILMPEIVHKNCPYVPYWNSSPYGGSTNCNDPMIGDDHHWLEEILNHLEFDEVNSSFISEYGFPGPCQPQSTKAYLDADEATMKDNNWGLHLNTCATPAVEKGLKKHYFDHEPSFEEYSLYGGMVQSFILNYSLEAIRSKPFCGGALFWMYNDCWGEVGWTIIDYYVRRKISYYGVKRAFETKKIILKQSDNMIDVMVINETNEDLSFDLKIGSMDFYGENDVSRIYSVTVGKYSRAIMVKFPMPDIDTTENVLYAMPMNFPSIKPAALTLHVMRELTLPTARFEVTTQCDVGNDKIISIKALTFVHGLYLSCVAGGEVEYNYSDNYIDLIPGQTIDITAFGGAGKLYSARHVNV